MYVRFPTRTALLLVLGGFAGCSGGGSGGTGSTGFNCASSDPKVLCLQNCNLGCTSTGCSRTDIAQNEIVILQFSEAVDPATVSTSSIRFRSPSGEQPVGEFFVNGAQVEFVPTLAISGGQTFFGFAAGETYTMTIPGGDGQTAVVRSASGKPFEKTLTCSLASTRGIVDLNGVAPRATLVRPTPSQLSGAPRDTEVVLEFNEMVDATPFLSGTASPVAFTVRRTFAGNNGNECDPESTPQVLNGTQRLDFDAARGISVLTFRPAQLLPGNICVEIVVTDGVSDLSGRSAQPQNFTFLTEVVPLVDQTLVENFDDEANIDRDGSGGSWSAGFASFARIGGDARHGSFDTSYLTEVTPAPVPGKRTFLINTDNTIVPQSNTTTGNAIAVTDGRFFFDKMVVPSDMRLTFTGANPPVFTVAGRIDIQGEIDIRGGSITAMPVVSATNTLGQPGAIGGVGGGNGGNGGNKGTGLAANPANNGSNGGDGRLLAGHAYFASATGTGGRGSTQFPASGLNAALFYGSTQPVAICVSAAAGGGGGGLLTPGLLGEVVSNNHADNGLTATSTGAGPSTITVAGALWTPNRYVGRTIDITGGVGAPQQRIIATNTADTITVTVAWTTVPTASAFSVPAGTPATGPDALGGTALQLFPFPVTPGLASSLHFLIGGSGGGGSGSQACMSLRITPQWAQGAGGAGGGGALGLRAGDSLRLAPTGRLLAAGGNAANTPPGTASGAHVAPAGGGSGGSFVLQTGRLVDLVGPTGSIDVRGGLGGAFDRSSGGSPAGTPPVGARVIIAGGNGGPGFVRLESPDGATVSQLTSMLPAATANNVGTLTETDGLVSTRSKFYSTNLIFGPQYVRYEIHAIVDGVPIVYSDDPAISNVPAGIGAPVRALFQAATLDLVSGEVLSTGPWRTGVRTTPFQTGIASDGLNGFRFMLIQDRSLSTTVTIDKVVVLYRV